LLNQGGPYRRFPRGDLSLGFGRKTFHGKHRRKGVGSQQEGVLKQFDRRKGPVPVGFKYDGIESEERSGGNGQKERRDRKDRPGKAVI